MDLKDGRVVIQLLPDLAPKAVARVKELTRRAFYDNTPFHRVIEGFMAQGGDPTGTGTGGSKLPDLPAEFTNKAHFLRGTVGAARTSDPNSANSQFFIMFAPAPSLDGQYTIWGQVVSGHGVRGPDQARQRRRAARCRTRTGSSRCASPPTRPEVHRRLDRPLDSTPPALEAGAARSL